MKHLSGRMSSDRAWGILRQGLCDKCGVKCGSKYAQPVGSRSPYMLSFRWRSSLASDLNRIAGGWRVLSRRVSVLLPAAEAQSERSLCAQQRRPLQCCLVHHRHHQQAPTLCTRTLLALSTASRLTRHTTHCTALTGGATAQPAELPLRQCQKHLRPRQGLAEGGIAQGAGADCAGVLHGASHHSAASRQWHNSGLADFSARPDLENHGMMIGSYLHWILRHL